MAFDYDTFLANIKGIAGTTRDVVGAGDADKYLEAMRTTGDIKEPSRYYPKGYDPLAGFGTGLHTFYSPEAKTGIREGTMLRRGYPTEMKRYGVDLRERAAVEALATKRETLGRQAEKAAAALEMKGLGAAEQLRRLEGVEFGEGGAEKAWERASTFWGEAVEKAGEYVEMSRVRTREVMGKLEEIFDDIGERREFGKAHAMNAAVQSVLGSMEAEGRAVAEEFGRDSKEYQQFAAKKTIALGTLNSNITANYQKMGEAQDQNYLNVYGATAERMAMYENFQEQQHVETLSAMATNSAMYDLQVGQLRLNLEQMRGSVYEDMANWIVQTPEFVMDLQPFANLMAELAAERARLPAEEIIEPQFAQRKVG